VLQIAVQITEDALSTRRPGHIPPTEQVEMNVPNNLTTTFITIIDDSEAILGKASIMGNFAGHLVDMADQLIVSSCQVKSRPDMLARHDKKMAWSLRINIFNNNDLLILVDEFTRDLPGYDFTEDAIVRHVLLLPQRL
jgi:hypothetical protein